MDDGSEEEEDGEDYCSGHGRVVTVVFKAFGIGLVGHGIVSHDDGEGESESALTDGRIVGDGYGSERVLLTRVGQ